MKDKKGFYYYPFPLNKRVRMYVREVGGAVLFRLWSADDPVLWEEHGWVPYDAIEQATAMYEGKGFDPRMAYDVEVAQTLLKEHSDSEGG